MQRAWLTEHEACQIVNRSPITLRNWRLAHLVQARKRKGVWEFEFLSLQRAAQNQAWQYQSTRAYSPERAEALQWLSECLQHRIPFPSVEGLARIMNVPMPYARNWRIQHLANMAPATFARTDAEIADRANLTESAVREARRKFEQHQRARKRQLYQ